jgi:curved DNA-binding protein CbpA
MVLGLPGNASQEEIDVAFGKAEGLFSRERLAEEDGALARLNEIRSAYQVLRDPPSRAAHDRKLLEQVRPAARPRPVMVAVEEPSPVRKVLGVGLVLVAVVFAAGIFVTHRNAESRRLLAAQELAARQSAEQEARHRQEEEERVAARRAATARQAEANERRLVQETRVSTARASQDMRMQEAAAAQGQRVELAEAQRREAVRLSDERRAAQEARMRTERDKQRVRDMCYQLYRRPDC